MEPPPPDGERVLSILTARLLAMPASAFADSADAAIPPVPTDELREALSDVAARSAQAAAVARLARSSHASNQLAEASAALQAPARAARREKLAALSGVCVLPRAAELLDMGSVQEALVAACAPTDGADAAARWREVAFVAQAAVDDEPDPLLLAIMAAEDRAGRELGGPPFDVAAAKRQHRAGNLVAALAHGQRRG